MANSITLTFIQLAIEEGKARAINKLGRIQTLLEDLLEAGSKQEQLHTQVLLDCVKLATLQVGKTNATEGKTNDTEIAQEPYEYLDLNTPFEKGDQAILCGGTKWFEIGNSVGQCLRSHRYWACARRPR